MYIYGSQLVFFSSDVRYININIYIYTSPSIPWQDQFKGEKPYLASPPQQEVTVRDLRELVT